MTSLWNAPVARGQICIRCRYADVAAVELAGNVKLPVDIHRWGPRRA